MKVESCLSEDKRRSSTSPTSSAAAVDAAEQRGEDTETLAALWASRNLKEAALEGNAAQRLGRHAIASEAYTRALGQRPSETRWWQALAISQAALGQGEQAAASLQRARALGPVSPDVVGYLQSLGIPTSD